MAYEQQGYIDGWQTYSDWIDNLRNNSEILLQLDKDTFFRSHLKACKTNYERFKFIWTNADIRRDITEYAKNDIYHINEKRKSRLSVKSAKESESMRSKGNHSFANGSYMDAFNKYTEAVRYAPYPNASNPDNSLALALANRSAALFSLAKYRLCLRDIDLAITYGYPEANKFKLLIRKVKCLHILSVWANDVEQIKDSLRKKLASPETKDNIKTEITNMFEFIESTSPESIDRNDRDVDDGEGTIKISNVSKSLPQAADCVEMSFDQEKGRYLLTNKDVSFGRLVIVEDPFVCNLAPSMRNHHCYHCLGQLHSCGLGCENCTQILYCSIECLQANASIHKYECNSFLDFQGLLGTAYLVNHIMFKIDFDLDKVPIQTKKTVEEKTLDDVLNISASNWPDLVYKNDYAAILSLMDHAEDYDYDEIMGYALTTAYLVTLYQRLLEGPKQELFSDEQFQLVIGSVVLRHIFQLQTNLISILNQNKQSLVSIGHKVNEMEEYPIGIGLYPTIALLNHSCSPNIYSIFHRNKFAVHASGSLECGTEINYCYGPSINRMSKKDRQKRLKDQYFFNCNCDCCVNDKEDVKRALKCPECAGPIIYNLDLTHRCMKCKKDNAVDVKSLLDKIEGLKKDLGKLSRSHSNDKRKLDKLNEIEKNLSDLLYWQNPLFFEVKSQKIECAENQEDFESSIKYCLEELDLSDKTHGENSLESIMTQLKYINLEWQRLFYKIEESDLVEVKESGKSELKLLLTKISTTRSKLKERLRSTNIVDAESSFDQELKFLSVIDSSINSYISKLDTSSEPNAIPDTEHLE